MNSSKGTHRYFVLSLMFTLLVLSTAAPADIPKIISYQGKVTDAGGVPVVDGNYPMRFWIYDVSTGGSDLWDSGPATVDVSGGVFSVLLGESVGSSIDLPFDEDYWLLVRFDGVNQTPRERLTSAGYAYMASGLVAGTEVVGEVSTGTWSAIKGRNTAASGFTYGGQFHASSPNGRGVFGWATATTGGAIGGQFWAASTEGKAVQGYASAITGSTYGVYGECSSNAGTGVYGEALAGSGTTYGVFGVSNSSAGRGVYGEVPASSGSTAGVHGRSYSSTGTAVLGEAFSPWGDAAGGRFSSTSGNGVGVYGIVNSTIGTTYGVRGVGNNSPSATGVDGEGLLRGGSFRDLETLVYSWVAYDTYKIYGTGSVSFVQNHPERGDQVIVYAAPEGDEVATYTRGTVRLVDGVARVSLGKTFKWVTLPDIGLTAHITPRGDCEGLYVQELTTSEMVVRELRGGTSDVRFDYLVYGLRVGFEEVSIVQEKKEEAQIPSMKPHHERYANDPDLRQHNPLERFRVMSREAGMSEPPDHGASRALHSAIGEHDPGRPDRSRRQ